MATHSNILACKSPWTKEPGAESDMTEQLGMSMRCYPTKSPPGETCEPGKWQFQGRKGEAEEAETRARRETALLESNRRILLTDVSLSLLSRTLTNNWFSFPLNSGDNNTEVNRSALMLPKLPCAPASGSSISGHRYHPVVNWSWYQWTDVINIRMATPRIPPFVN